MEIRVLIIGYGFTVMFLFSILEASTVDENRKCTRYFYTETVRHPKKDCNEKVL